MTFDRLLPADGVAMLAAIALVFAMALDWYSTSTGDEARRVESIAQPRGGAAGQIDRELRERASIAAEQEERNAWRLEGALGVLLPAALLVTFALSMAAGYVRMAGRRPRPPLTASALTALSALAAGLLVGYAVLDEPGLDAATTVKAGPAVALVLLGVIALACRAAMREEEAGTAWHELPSERAAAQSSLDGVR